MTDIKVFEGITSVAFSEKLSDNISAYDIFDRIGAGNIDIDMISVELALNDTLFIGFTLSDEDLPELLPLIRSENISTPAVNCGNVKFVIQSEDMINCPGYAARVFKGLKEAGCTPLLITTSVDEISILVRDSDSGDVGIALEKIIE